MTGDLSNLSHLEVFERWREVMDELKGRELVRSTAQSPLGDYAEVLVAEALPANRPSGPDRGWDLERFDTGARVQVKARRAAGGKTPTHLGDLSRLDEKLFDELAAVIFNEDFRVAAAWLLTHDAVRELAKPQSSGKWRLRISSIQRAAEAGNEPVRALRLDQT